MISATSSPAKNSAAPRLPSPRSGFKSPVAAVYDRRIAATPDVSTAVIDRRYSAKSTLGEHHNDNSTLDESQREEDKRTFSPPRYDRSVEQEKSAPEEIKLRHQDQAGQERAGMIAKKKEWDRQKHQQEKGDGQKSRAIFAFEFVLPKVPNRPNGDPGRAD